MRRTSPSSGTRSTNQSRSTRIVWQCSADVVHSSTMWTLCYLTRDSRSTTSTSTSSSAPTSPRYVTVHTLPHSLNAYFSFSAFSLFRVDALSFHYPRSPMLLLSIILSPSCPFVQHLHLRCGLPIFLCPLPFAMFLLLHLPLSFSPCILTISVSLLSISHLCLKQLLLLLFQPTLFPQLSYVLNNCYCSYFNPLYSPNFLMS